jgi:hypothetical protein
MSENSFDYLSMVGDCSTTELQVCLKHIEKLDVKKIIKFDFLN